MQPETGTRLKCKLAIVCDTHCHVQVLPLSFWQLRKPSENFLQLGPHAAFKKFLFFFLPWTMMTSTTSCVAEKLVGSKISYSWHSYTFCLLSTWLKIKGRTTYCRDLISIPNLVKCQGSKTSFLILKINDIFCCFLLSKLFIFLRTKASHRLRKTMQKYVQVEQFSWCS